MPAQLVNRTRINGATEDATWLYWFDGDGTLYRCAPADCAGTQAVHANGSWPTAIRLLQDATSLYWSTQDPYQIIRVAK